MDAPGQHKVANKFVSPQNFAAGYTPLDWLRHKPYLDSMLRDVAIFLACFFRALLAVLLILCLAIAPICTARCASTLCADSGQPAESCHHSSVPTSDAPVIASIAKSIPCQAANLLLASPRVEEFLSSLESQLVAKLFLPATSRPGLAFSAANFEHSFFSLVLFDPPGSALPLRI
jgi:hypothetical protein